MTTSRITIDTMLQPKQISGGQVIEDDVNVAIHLPTEATLYDKEVLLRSRCKRRNGVQIDDAENLKNVLLRFLSMKYTLQMGMIL